MNRVAMLTSVALLAIPTAAVASTRTLDHEAPSESLQRVAVHASVGDVEVIAVDRETVAVEVELKPRRGGIFSSLRRAEREVEEARLEVETVSGVLHLSIGSDASDRRFEERWTIEIPARLAIDLELGVGNASIRGTSGGVAISSGVGDLLLEVLGGDIDLDAGVGDINVTAPEGAYAKVESSTGVGDTRLTVRDRPIAAEGLVGHSTSWKGQGSHTISIDCGVGDSRIALN